MTLRAPLAVVRTEVRRTFRVIAGDRSKLFVNLVGALVATLPVVLIGSFLLPSLGERVAAGEVDPGTATSVATGGAALLWTLVAVIGTVRTVTSAANLDEPAFLLVSTSVRNVVLGVLGSLSVLAALWLVPPVLLLAGLFASGHGSPLPVALAAVVIVAVLVTALPVAFVVGVWIRHLLTAYEPVARHKTAVTVAAAVAYFGVLATGWFDEVVGTAFTAFADSPLGWPGHLFLLAVPDAAPSTPALAGAAVATVAIPVVAVRAATYSATVHWFADAAKSQAENETVSSSNRLEGLLSGGLPRPVRAVAVTAIRRTKRAPVRLLYVAYPLLGAIGFVQGAIQAGELPTFVAVLLCGYVVWGSGALFTLNPLGDPGRAMPAVLTSPITGRQVMAGLVVAGALVSVPVAVLVGVVAGLVSPLGTQSSALLLGATVVGAVVAPALATGIGALFPRFGSVRVTRNREAVMPSKTAFVAYTVALALPAGAALVLYRDGAPDLVATASSFLLSQLPAVDPTVSPTAVWTLSAVVLPLGLLAPFVSVALAVWRYDTYTLD